MGTDRFLNEATVKLNYTNTLIQLKFFQYSTSLMHPTFPEMKNTKPV